MEFERWLATILSLAISIYLGKVTAETGYISIDGKSIEIWYSQPFDHVCLLDCDHELVTLVGGAGGVSIFNRNCSVQCEGQQSLQRKMGKETRYERFPIKNPYTNAVSDCLIGVIQENIFCAVVTVHSKGFRKVEIENSNQCRRRNERYFLPQPNCIGAYSDVGEETCEKACVHDEYTEYMNGKASRGDSSESHQISIDVTRVRAKFRVCYKGRVKKRTSINRFLSITGSIYNFCRAEMTSCSSCFRWTDWRELTPCSSTCGTPGHMEYYRTCEIKDHTDNFGTFSRYKRISQEYCIAYFGGAASKQEACNPSIPCPQWTAWGSWAGCESGGKSGNPTVTTKRISNCTKSRRRRSIELNLNSEESPSSEKASTVASAVGVNTNQQNYNIHVTLLPKSIFNHTTSTITLTNSTNKSEGNKAPLTIIGFENHREIRTRKCTDSHGNPTSGCQGNSTEYATCAKKRATETPRKVYDTVEDCEDESTTPRETNPTSMSSEARTIANSSTAPFPVATVHQTHVEVNKTKAGPRLFPMTSRPRRKANFTLSDDEFTSVLTVYAPVFIAGLLVFIILLLVILIVICGTRILQKNKKRYEFTTPSFSAGTMGSIPSGIVQGFAHPLGLRRGSGTFGRSVSTLNGVGIASDALSSRGSNRSMASAVSGSNVKAKNKPHHKRFLNLTSSAKGKANKGNDYYSARNLSNTEKSGIKKPELENKPSSSSILSNTSSLCNPAPTPSSCSFQPLPPIPLDQTPHGLDSSRKSPFQRGTGRSASLTPGEYGAQRDSPPTEIVNGRAGRRTYTLAVGGVHYYKQREQIVDENWSRTWQSRQKVTDRPTGRSAIDRSQPLPNAYLKHAGDERTCAQTSKLHANKKKKNSNSFVTSTENEYWSVTSGENFDSSNESSDTSKQSKSNPPKKKPRGSVESRGIPMQIIKQKVGKMYSSASAKSEHDDDSVEMVDNVLYAVTTDALVHQSASDDAAENSEALQTTSNDLSSSGDGSVPSHLGSCGGSSEKFQKANKLNKQSSEDRFYNTIDFEDSSRGSDLDISQSEDDYDHLSDQFSVSLGARPKTKFPGTMTSLRQLHHQSLEQEELTNFEDNTHDYECIEFEEDGSKSPDVSTESYSRVKPSKLKSSLSKNSIANCDSSEAVESPDVVLTDLNSADNSNVPLQNVAHAF